MTVNCKLRTLRTIADVLDRLGRVPPERVLIDPPLGTATVDDVIRLNDREDRLCELVDGVLLEKIVGLRESRLAVWIAGILNLFVIPHNLGFVTGPDGAMQLFAGLVRIPDIAFVKWERVPGGRIPDAPVPLLAPNLAVEVLSSSNTPGEMQVVREEYFSAGVDLVWEIDPDKRCARVCTSPTDFVTLSSSDVLDGASVLPGFQLPLADVFGEMDRHA
jgi:Uma2 family endonuclease